MKKFLEQVAEEILLNYGNHDTHLKIILPNKRSEIFLKNYLKEKTTETYWIPNLYTTDEFIIKQSGLNLIDPILIYFELYNIHKNLEDKKAMPIEDFLSWAPIMLSDFNDIDLYMADAKHVFTHLTETKALEQWNLSGQPLTELQSDYIFFYQSLFTYYTELKSNLLGKELGYKGMIYRQLSENIETLTRSLKGSKFIIIGLNALSETEKDIFGYLNDHFETVFYWDTDEYYIFPKKTASDQIEAGRFINDLINKWNLTDIKWINKNLVSTKKTFHIHGIPKQMGQVKYIGQQLRNWKEKLFLNPETIDTAIVLADENLLLPLLHSLPQIEIENEGEIPYNLTMGYPLKNTILCRFILQWINFLIKAEDFQFQKFDTWQLISLLKAPILSSILDKKGTDFKNSFLNGLTKKNQFFYSPTELEDIVEAINSQTFKKLFSILFYRISNSANFIKALIEFLQLFAEVSKKEGKDLNAILSSQINLAFTIAKKLKSLIIDNESELSLKALQKILDQLFRRSEISLKGEPLSGIQIMGMLETRNLDFKNIILVSANEGILPKATELESFIPFDIRHDNHLPLPKEQNDVIAYHFYRLMQRAENITILYNTDSNKIGSGEKSRFILQLENELAKTNKLIDIHRHITNINIGTIPKKQTITISKSKDVLQRITEKTMSGLSASALNIYRNCKLKFYFREILKLQEKHKIEPEIEFNVFGNAIHGVLEEIYEPFIGKTIDPNTLKRQLQKVDILLKNELTKIYRGGNIRTGKNHLIYEVAKKYIEQFLLSEIEDHSTPEKLIIGLEEMIEVDINDKGRKVKLKGYLDRIEKLADDNQVSIIDYKTGKVEPRDLELKDWETLADKSKDKLFQLLFYAYLYQNKYPQIASPSIGIYSLRMLSHGLIEPNLPDNENPFEEYLLGLIDEIVNPDVDFDQTTDEKICSYCDYKEVCNK